MLTPEIEIPVFEDRIRQADRLFLNKLGICIKLKLTDPVFGVSKLSKLIVISPAQLNRKLISLTGYSTGRLIKYFRLQVAKYWLVESEISIKEIAWLSGFNDQVSFCRNIQREFGCSPSQYRASRRLNGKHKLFLLQIPLKAADFETLFNLACQKPWLNNLLKIVIESSCNENQTTGQLASALYLSTSSLNRKVKGTFSVTPQRLIRDLKLQYASELLISKDWSIAKVAQETGFFDHAHFCHCFKQAFGCSPSTFNSDNKQENSISWVLKNLMIQNDK
jgi:AraC-like DNA-binding protein